MRIVVDEYPEKSSECLFNKEGDICMLSKYGGGKCPSAGWNGCSKLIKFNKMIKNNRKAIHDAIW